MSLAADNGWWFGGGVVGEGGQRGRLLMLNKLMSVQLYAAMRR